MNFKIGNSTTIVLNRVDLHPVDSRGAKKGEKCTYNITFKNYNSAFAVFRQIFNN
jgi:hypothetical protein